MLDETATSIGLADSQLNHAFSMAQAKLNHGNDQSEDVFQSMTSVHSLHAFLNHCHAGETEAAYRDLERIEQESGAESVAVLELKADLASALIDKGNIQGAQAMIEDNNHAIISNNKAWLYIAARLYSAQEKHWKAHCHFMWSLPENLGDAGLLQLCELLENSSQLGNNENLVDILAYAAERYADNKNKCSNRKGNMYLVEVSGGT